MAVAANSFDAWLSEKLQALNTDESVFGTYIKGILESDEPEDEKTEALEGILAGVTVSAIETSYADIFEVSMRAVAISRSKIDARPSPKVCIFASHVHLSSNLDSRARVFRNLSSTRCNCPLLEEGGKHTRRRRLKIVIKVKIEKSEF